MTNPVKQVRVEWAGTTSDQVSRIVTVFTRQVESRCPATIVTQGAAPLTVALTLDPAIGKEGFRISDSASGRIEVAGQNELGVLYGLGKLLRTSRYSADGFAPGSWRGTSVPQKTRRGIYFATHFHNYYHEAPLDEICRYVEDLALWGLSELVVWYDMHHFNGFDDPEAVAFRKRLHTIMAAAKRIGMDASLVVIANEAYNNSPQELRADPSAKRGGWYDCAVCPSKPGGMEYILSVLGEEFDWAADLKPRSVWIWPYDQGGCGCAACNPWGSNGYLKCVEEVGDLAQRKMPGVEIILSTWFMKENEWQGVRERLAKDKDLAQGIISEPGPHGIRIDPGDLGLPLLGFPEISMHETFPWGGFGATPLTARAQVQWDTQKQQVDGGYPYSEGLYEDITKVVYSQFYWSDQPAAETVKEYIAFEFSPDAVEDVAGVIRTLEQNHHMRWWPGKLEGMKLDLNWFPSKGTKPRADPGAEEAYATMRRIDGLLTPQARTSWRWRQLYLRALLDSELKTNGGTPNETCNAAFAELIKLYHAENANPAVRPPLPKEDATIGADLIAKAELTQIGTSDLMVVPGEKSTPAEKRVSELLAERVKERTGIAPAGPEGKSVFRVVIGTVTSNDRIAAFAANRKDIGTLGRDGYVIAFDPRQADIYIAGQSDSGVVAGAGRLMREMRYEPGAVLLPALNIRETPRMPNRGVYLWARKHYFNHPDRVDRYIEELALWGCNAICLWFEMGMFKSFGDAAPQDARIGFHDGHRNALSPQEWLALSRRFHDTARRMGMKTGLLMAANDAYRTSPEALRIEPIIGCPDWYMCPSKPGSVEQMVAWQEEVFEALAPIDIFNIFPADAGGCSCKECTPWPTRGLWKVAQALGEKIHAISPETEIWLDTWHLNHPTFGGQDWKNLVGMLDGSKKRPEWLTGFEVGIAPHHGFARMSAEDRNVYNRARRPLTVFAEISMFANHAGVLVKKDYWKSLQDELNDYDPELLRGGWLYAERWNTDIAIAMFNAWYWNPKKPVDEVLDEWAGFYFGPGAETGRELLDLLDDGNKDPNRKQKIQETFARLDASTPEWVTRDWRWDEIKASASRFTH